MYATHQQSRLNFRSKKRWVLF
uniref:Uncharacterized protein n=1 Tax=Rhizophora mucronata TaxID=61149 RepID=A0A2P2PVR5_RHIMU